MRSDKGLLYRVPSSLCIIVRTTATRRAGRGQASNDCRSRQMREGDGWMEEDSAHRRECDG